MSESTRKPQSEVKTKQDWTYLPIVRYLTFGFKKKCMDCVFESIPQHVATEFKRILKKVDTMLCERIQNQVYLGDGETDCRQGIEMIDYECKMWKEQNICGYLKITYEPASQEPIKVQLNDKFSQYAGVKCKEFPKCLADHDLPLPCPELDFFFLMIHDSKLATQSRVDRSVHEISSKNMENGC